MKKYLVALLFLAVPVLVFAHGEGESFETVASGYVIDVGYSEPAPVAGEAVSFDFKLRPEGSAEGAETSFSSVWVRIESDEGAFLFASGVANAEFGGARMSYAFPKAGTYTIEVRYENEGESLANAGFTLAVEEASEAAPAPLTEAAVPFGVGIFLGALAVVLWVSRKKIIP